MSHESGSLIFTTAWRHGSESRNFLKRGRARESGEEVSQQLKQDVKSCTMFNVFLYKIWDLMSRSRALAVILCKHTGVCNMDAAKIRVRVMINVRNGVWVSVRVNPNPNPNASASSIPHIIFCILHCGIPHITVTTNTQLKKFLRLTEGRGGLNPLP